MHFGVQLILDDPRDARRLEGWDTCAFINIAGYLTSRIQYRPRDL